MGYDQSVSRFCIMISKSMSDTWSMHFCPSEHERHAVDDDTNDVPIKVTDLEVKTARAKDCSDLCLSALLTLAILRRPSQSRC